MYDMVFGYADGDPDRPAFGAGVAVFLTGLVLFRIQGRVLLEDDRGDGRCRDRAALPGAAPPRRRLRVLPPSRCPAPRRESTWPSTRSRWAGRSSSPTASSHYEPLTPGTRPTRFPVRAARRPDRQDRRRIDSLETHFGPRARRRNAGCLRRGVDFDHVVLAVSVGMIPVVAKELIDDRPDWREMTTHIRTVATQAFQIWLRPDDHALGWNQPGVTISAYAPPFDTWASMPQTLWAEDWPERRPARRGRRTSAAASTRHGRHPRPTPNTCAGICETSGARKPRCEYLDRDVGPVFCPNAVTDGRLRLAPSSAG